jgi:hypothetical protein
MIHRYKLTEVEKETVKEEMRAVLIHLARTRQTATYTDVTLMLQSVYLNPGSYIFTHLLSEVCGEEWAKTGVMICALVVSKLTGIPGAGYFRGMAQLGFDCSDIQRCWQEEVERVFTYWSDAS